MKDNLVKLFCTVIFTAIAVLIGGCGRKAGEPFSGPLGSFKRYSLERFHLTYEYSGDVRGTEDLFVSEYGRYEARFSKFDVFTEKGINSQNNGALTRLIDMYTMDFTAKKGRHQRMQYFDSLYHLEGKEIPTPQEYLEFEMKRNFFKNAGTDTLAGKTATRWQQVDGDLTLWVWNGILLRKHASSQNGALDMRIKNIDSLWKVDTSMFSIPAGINFSNETK